MIGPIDGIVFTFKDVRLALRFFKMCASSRRAYS